MTPAALMEKLNPFPMRAYRNTSVAEVKPGRLQGSDEGPSDGLVDLDTADVEAIDAAVLDENLARAVVTWRGVATTIVGVQTATAMTTAGQPLQERAALPD